MNMLLLRLNDGPSRHPHAHAAWMAAFAERLLELEPKSLGLDAVRVAMHRFAVGAVRDPIEAAEAYAAELETAIAIRPRWG
jgi:hypothetical protein